MRPRPWRTAHDASQDIALLPGDLDSALGHSSIEPSFADFEPSSSPSTLEALVHRYSERAFVSA